MRKVTGIVLILQHKNIISKVRYNIMTTVDNCFNVTKIMKNNTSTWVNTIKKQQAVAALLDYPDPDVCFKNNFEEDSYSGTSMNPYLSACSLLYTAKSNRYNAPWVTTTTPVQSWPSQATTT